jgi:hypothetical protein
MNPNREIDLCPEFNEETGMWEVQETFLDGSEYAMHSFEHEAYADDFINSWNLMNQVAEQVESGKIKLN